MIAASSGAQEYYFSNPLGMILSDAGEYDIKTGKWVLERTKDGNKEIRVLYHNGLEYKRIIRIEDADGFTIQEVKNNVPVSESVYIKGRISEETEISPEGIKRLSKYIWGSDNLKEIRWFEDGKLIYRDVYITGSNGVLFQVKRVMPDGSSQISGYDYGNTGIKRQWNIKGDDDTIFFYEDESLSAMEVYKDREIVSSIKTEAADEGKVQIDYNTLNKETVKRKFDNRGRVVEEEISSPEKLRIITYKYNNSDKLSVKSIREPGSREVHEYHYDIKGDLEREDVFKNGNLLKTVRYLEGNRKEETVFRNGTALMKVILEDDMEISRENLIER